MTSKGWFMAALAIMAGALFYMNADMVTGSLVCFACSSILGKLEQSND